MSLATFAEKIFMPFCRVMFLLFILALSVVCNCIVQYLSS
jgi:hypothetical protein